MRIKQKPEDFVVKESWRFDEVKGGEYRVYLMDKQKLSTFDAIDRISREFKLPKGVFSYCGLKDKQGRTEQLIAVRGFDVDMQEEDLRLKYLGRTDAPLSAANTTSNRFGVTVRALDADAVARLPQAVAEVNRLGVINYFDSQRFGSLKHGQGFIAKDLLRGDFQTALKNYMAVPSPLDRTNDAKVKAFWRDHWGEWKRRCTIEGAEKYENVLRALRHDPEDFRQAFLRIDAKYRAMQVFAYQSWLWNEGVRRLLMGLLPRESLIAIGYQAGTLLFPRDAPPEVAKRLRKMTFPLVGPETKIDALDPDVRKALLWVLQREKLTVEGLTVPETPEIFFRHEDREVTVVPGRLLMGEPRPDELNRGRSKVYFAFTLPPGAYATLVIRRLLHFSPEDAVHEEPVAEDELAAGPVDVEAAAEPLESAEKGGTARRERGAKGKKPAAAPAKPPVEKTPKQAEAEPVPKVAPMGFRARQKLLKEQKATRRAEATKKKSRKR
ncbi:MAG: tRNA pseudouridine(13) synthase TruD [Myxococcales bacterium]